MEKYDNRETIEIDLKRLLSVLWSRAWIILLVSALAGGLSYGYARFFIAPTYAASTRLYVNNNYVDSPGFSSSQITAAQDLANTYMVILESRSVLEKVRDKTNLGYTYGQLKGMISAYSVDETEVFEVKVTCGDYRHAAVIANAVADVLPDKIATVVEGSSVRVVDYAVENSNPVGPNYQSFLLLGAVSGFSLCAMILTVLELLDTTIYSEEYLVQTYEALPLLTVIPGTGSARSGYYKGYYEMPHNKRSSSKRGGVKG